MWKNEKKKHTHSPFPPHPTTIFQLGPCLLRLRERMSPAIPAQSSNRQCNWSYKHKYAMLPKYEPSRAVIQNWFTGVIWKHKSYVNPALLGAVS